MTLIESSVAAGMLIGAIAGVSVAKTHGTLALIAGPVAGLAAGAIVGWVYAMMMVTLLALVGTLWSAALRRKPVPASEADMRLMTGVAVLGTFTAALVSLLCWSKFGWFYAITALAAVSLVTSIAAVLRCELT